MTVAVGHGSSSSFSSSLLSSSSSSSSFSLPSPLTYTTASSSIKAQSISDGGIDKSLKRKRSSSHHPQLLSEYPTPSLPESFKAIVKTEEQDQQRKRGLIQKRTQEPTSKQELHDCPSSFPTLHHDSNTTLFPPACLAFPVEETISSSVSEIEAHGTASYNSREQGTQTGLELPVSQAYLDWDGRGRSPFKTPAIAAIDGLKKGAKVIEWLEREAAKERKELEKLIQWKIHCVTGLKRTTLEIVQDKMDPLKKVEFLVKPKLDIDDYTGKSRSPDKYLGKMKHSIPPVHHELLEMYQPDLPEQMNNLLELLEEKLDEAYIPSKYEADMKLSHPNGLRNVPRSAFSAMETRSELSVEKLWEKAWDMVEGTLECINQNADENAWGTRVVQKALEWETWGPERKCERPTFSRAENIQSQLLAESCRQRYQGNTFETKKTDWALLFSPNHLEVQRQYNALESNGNAPTLSQMNNLYTSKMILYSGIEIKVPNGNGSEAKAQLFTWFQAGISRLRKLLKKIGNGTPATDPTLPLLGWTVIGERWELYMALGDGNGEADPITILGPFPTCQCITRNYPGAFGLLRLMEKIKDWAREVYWPWYCEAVIEPLKLVKDQPLTQEEETDKAVDVEEREALEEH